MVQDWIQWLVSFPISQAPIFDSTGDNVQKANKDTNNIFFLTGAPYKNATRNVTIDSNRYSALFFPVIDGIFTYQPTGIFAFTDFFGSPHDILYERNNKFQITEAIATFDGQPLKMYKAKSTVFMMHYNEDNPYKIKEGNWNTLVTGDFIYLPITDVRGNHTLHLKGQDTDGYHQEVTYHLHIVS
jgi:hypothetical protein